MKKLFIAPAIALLLVGCGKVSEEVAAPKLRQVRGLVVTDIFSTYNVNGYTKETSFKFVDEVMNDTHYFHAGANARNLKTFYHVDEEMLYMSDLNSGYRNNDDGVEHFKNNAEKITVENLFTSVEVDCDFEAQFVGKYYPTLDSLGKLLKPSEWVEEDGVYTYSIAGLVIEEGDYNDKVLKNFQFFAAPMLLQTEEFAWSSIRFKEEENYLSIKLYVTKGENPVSQVIEGNEEVVSEAKIYKGIQL